MSLIQVKPPTNIWITASWEEYLEAIADPHLIKASGYYHRGQMRIEAMPVGSDHANDHAIILFVLSLFATVKGIPLNAKDNCSYRKSGIEECQPDASFYIGKNAAAIPWGVKTVDLDQYPLPDLVIEVADSSLADDKGEKRLQYEDLGIAEYWIVDVRNVEVIAFAIADGGSRRINQSQTLPGLSLSLVTEALIRSRQMTQSAVGSWLLTQFQSP